MSYDIRFGVKVDGMNDYIAIIDAPKYDSPTYNLRDMFVACMNWNYKQGEWYNCSEIIPKVERGVHELRFHKKEYEVYNSPNGWGNVDSALVSLESILEKAQEIVSGTEENTIPLENLWMKW